VVLPVFGWGLIDIMRSLADLNIPGQLVCMLKRH